MMDFMSIETEYEWVLKTLNSSTSMDHINVSDKLFDAYITKWSDELSDVKLMKINSTYERQKSLKIVEIQKNIN
jgi:hypothetical protein